MYKIVELKPISQTIGTFENREEAVSFIRNAESGCFQYFSLTEEDMTKISNCFQRKYTFFDPKDPSFQVVLVLSYYE